MGVRHKSTAQPLSQCSRTRVWCTPPRQALIASLEKSVAVAIVNAIDEALHGPLPRGSESYLRPPGCIH
jgi:hypothetical protein